MNSTLILDFEGGRASLRGHQSFSAGPSGALVGWHWDDADQRLIVQNRAGLFPLYILDEPGHFGISTSAVELLASARDKALNVDAIAVFLRLGFFIGNDTPFASIRSFPRADTLTWQGGKWRASGTFIAPPATAINRAEILRTYGRLFADAVKRSAPKWQVVVPLSGGRDSRHVILELARQAITPEFCLTVQRSRAASPLGDVEVAQHLAKRLGFEHRVVDASRASHTNELAKNVATSFCSDEHAWCLAVVKGLGTERKSVYDGIGGDMLSAGLFLQQDLVQLYERGHIPQLAEALLRPGREDFLRRLFQGSVLSRFSRDRAKANLIKELEAHATTHNPLTHFYFWNRTRREIGLYTFSMLGIRHEVHTPFLDEQLMSFLLSIPTEATIDKNLHTEALLSIYPDFADVRFATNPPSRRPDAASGLLWAGGMSRLLWSQRGIVKSLSKDIFGPTLFGNQRSAQSLATWMLQVAAASGDLARRA